MTTTGKTFKWMLWPSHGELSTASDEFLAEEFRVRLMGNRLEVSFEAPGTCSLESVKVLAEKYVETLATHLVMLLSLMTEAEWMKRTTPPFGNNMTMLCDNRRDPSRVMSAVRAARNELLPLEDETLRRCYDHLQDARKYLHTPNDEGMHFEAYKAMEVLENHFGGESKAVAALGETFKKAKTAANTKRHIPEKVQRQPKTSVGAFELATRVIRRYEQYLLEKEHKKKEDHP
jgi:hypothetical protein